MQAPERLHENDGEMPAPSPGGWRDSAPLSGAFSRLRSLATRHNVPVRQFAPIAVLVAIWLISEALTRDFLTVRNLATIADQSAIPAVAAAGLTFVIISGSIDLSLEGNMALCGVIASLLIKNSNNSLNLGWLSLPIIVAIGATIGLINGLVHARLRIPSFIATFGMWQIALGLAYLLYGGYPVVVEDLPIRKIAYQYIGSVPDLALVAAGVLLICYGVQRWTKLGRYTFALGGNEVLATNAGIPIRRYKVMLFVLAGVLFSVAGFLTVLQLGQGVGTIGTGDLFASVAAVVVGGNAITGGVGGIPNTIIGVLIIESILDIMVLKGVTILVQQGVEGLVLVIGLALTIDRSRIRILK